MSDKNYITKIGYAKLKEELQNLVTVERPQLVQTINWAASNGDRSENADYIYGKRRLREIDKRIYFLTKKLENIEVVEHKLHAGIDQVFFGATVTILRNNEDTQVIKIVGEDEINPNLNYISWNSPLAKLLLRKFIGDNFKMTLPRGEDMIEVLDVIYD